MSERNGPNPVLDISAYRVPLDLSLIFGRDNPRALEIGFGDGDFLIETALANPGTNYLGIEIKKRRFNKAIKKAARKKVKNVKFLHMDAVLAARELFNPDSFQTIYINFPDPWPKDRHSKHRIVNRPFLMMLSGLLIKDGVLEIASDHVDYILNSLDTLKGIEVFRNDYGDPGYVNEIPGRPFTKYEREFREEGRQIYYLGFTNNK